MAVYESLFMYTSSTEEVIPPDTITESILFSQSLYLIESVTYHLNENYIKINSILNPRQTENEVWYLREWPSLCRLYEKEGKEVK